MENCDFDLDVRIAVTPHNSREGFAFLTEGACYSFNSCAWSCYACDGLTADVSCHLRVIPECEFGWK